MTITQGKIHIYLLMKIDYCYPGEIILSMFDYIGNMLHDFPEDIRAESATPDAHDLFYIAEDATKLSQTNADIFHHFMVQLLYLSNQ